MAPTQRPKYMQEQRDQALALYRTEGPTAVEKQLGIPKNTVAGWARKAGVGTVRTAATREAVEAKVADGKLRRASITSRLYGQVEKMLSDLEGDQFTTLVKGAGGAEHEAELGFVPPNDRRTLIQSVASAVASAMKLEDYDRSAADGTARADSVVDRLIAGFTRAYEAGE